MRGLRRAAACAAALLLALALPSCALLGHDRKAEAGKDAASSDDGPTVAMVELEVDAPGDLKPLLENNLDLARLRRLAGRETVSDTELARLVAAAPAQVRELLETEGYFDPVVQVTRTPGDPPHVRVSVQPGPRATISRLTFEIEGELGAAADAGDERARVAIGALREAWTLKPGMPFRNAAWSDAKNAALAQLRAEGYAAATWSGTAAEVDGQTDKVRLFVVADSGPLFHAGPLQIQGLEHQDEASVRNLAGFGPGAPVTDQLLLDFQERLQTSGLFDRASVVMDPDPEHAGAARIEVKVHELSLQQAVLGAGFSTNAGPRLSLEHWHRRVFGMAATARNKIEWGRDRQALEGEISSHAKHDLWRNLVGYSLERLKTSSDTVTSARGRVGRAQDTPRTQRLYYLEAENARRVAGDTHEHSHAISANYHWGWRELDSNVLPTRGFSIALQTAVGQASDNSGRSGAFSRLYGRLTGYVPLGHNWFGNARIELGQVSTANEVEVPDTLRFRAGGDDSVRGYANRALAPTENGALIGGKALFTSSVELAHPITAKLPSVWWAAFIDAGRAAERFSDLKPAYGYGVGLRWRSPVGPLKVDVAHGNEAKGVRLHLSVGIAF
jgi:translocation and assembly module TamA